MNTPVRVALEVLRVVAWITVIFAFMVTLVYLDERRRENAAGGIAAEASDR